MKMKRKIIIYFFKQVHANVWLGIEQCFKIGAGIFDQTNPVPDMHDKRSRNILSGSSKVIDFSAN